MCLARPRGRPPPATCGRGSPASGPRPRRRCVPSQLSRRLSIIRPGGEFDQKAGIGRDPNEPDRPVVGRTALPRSSRRLVPWAAVGFSLLWGAMFGLGIVHGDIGRAALSGAGMVFTLGLTVMLYREHTQ